MACNIFTISVKKDGISTHVRGGKVLNFTILLKRPTQHDIDEKKITILLGFKNADDLIIPTANLKI